MNRKQPTLQETPDHSPLDCALSRRGFLVAGSTAVASMTVLLNAPGMARGQKAAIVRYPRKKIGQLSSLKNDQPAQFNYPDDGRQSFSLLVKLGTPAGGGVGKGSDVVAFNSTCTHQGGPLSSSYKAATKTLGACPLHLSTFDLTRYGILVSGQAYQSLPQVLLELEGDDIYAVGMMGLIFGRNDNLKG